MGTTNVTSLKKEIIAHCRQHVEAIIRSAEEAIRMAQQSANEETKSSSGDKYETGRAMAQLEIEKGSSQLAEARKLMQALEHTVVVGQESESVRLGSLVYTSRDNYFLAIPAGKCIINDVPWYAISPSSPMGAVLMGHKSGETAVFNGKEFRITKVA